MPATIQIKETTHVLTKGKGKKVQFFAGVEDGKQVFTDNPVEAKLVEVTPEVAAVLDPSSKLVHANDFLDEFGAKILADFGEVPDMVKAARARLNSLAQKNGPKKGERAPRRTKKQVKAQADAGSAGVDTRDIDPDGLVAAVGA